tara:strand:- start:102 stop:1301 length:1200 start_codon:yes stop_codon:yes gene_type:complete
MLAFTMKNLIIKGIELKQMHLDGACEASYLGNSLKVFGGIQGEIVDVEVIAKQIDLICNVIKVIKPDQDRILKKCDHFLECSGCQFQHIGYKKQLDIKKNFVNRTLLSIDKDIDKKIEGVIPSEKKYNYRNHARFSVSKSKEYNGNSGFINRWTRKLVNISRCEIMNEEINSKRDQTKGKLKGMSQFSLRVAVKNDSYLIQPDINNINILTGQKYYYEEFKNINVRISSPSFFQVNIEQAEKLGDLISNIASLSGKETVIDAFAGVGTFSLLLSKKVKKIYAIESSYSSIEDAKENLKNLKNVELIQNEVENLSEDYFEEIIDMIILDPSRKGVHLNALNWVLRLLPSQIIYVSCNIETLKNDLKILQRKYEINKILPIDMFPQTKHVECVVNLTRFSE